jgi:hypothetical protein
MNGRGWRLSGCRVRARVRAAAGNLPNPARCQIFTHPQPGEADVHS